MSRILRILKIYKIESPQIGCVFSNGEYRLIDVESLFNELGIREGDFGFELLRNADLFNTVQLLGGTLSWKSLTKNITLPGGKVKALSFEPDPTNLYKYSKPDPSKKEPYKVGHLIKKVRSGLNLSQDALARSIGSNKQYVSRIENDKSDIEFNTLNRIFEMGFDKKVCLTYYVEDDFINTYSNSFFTNSFLVWIEYNCNRIDLIEGISEAIIEELAKENIQSTSALAELSYEKLKNILERNPKNKTLYDHPETWAIQAKYLQHKDWFNLVKLQRMLKSNPDDTSKLEMIARRETKQNLFVIH